MPPKIKHERFLEELEAVAQHAMQALASGESVASEGSMESQAEAMVRAQIVSGIVQAYGFRRTMDFGPVRPNDCLEGGEAAQG